MSKATTPASTPADGQAATPATPPASENVSTPPAPPADVKPTEKQDAKPADAKPKDEAKGEKPAAKGKKALPSPLVAAPAKDAAPAEGEKAAEKTVDYELDVPEGFDPGAAGTIRALAAELELDKPRAQKIVDRFMKATAEAEEAREAAFVEQAEQYVKAAADHEAVKSLGGLDKARALASRALAKFDAGGEFGEALQASGLAYHPGVLVALARVGATLSEDTTRGAAGAPPSAQKDPRFALYTHPTSRSMFKE